MPTQRRRRFLTNAAFAGAAGVSEFGAWGKLLAAQPPPEITKIRCEKEPHKLHRTASHYAASCRRSA
jgi:hypothetical protein